MTENKSRREVMEEHKAAAAAEIRKMIGDEEFEKAMKIFESRSVLDNAILAQLKIMKGRVEWETDRDCFLEQLRVIKERSGHIENKNAFGTQVRTGTKNPGGPR